MKRETKYFINSLPGGSQVKLVQFTEKDENDKVVVAFSPEIPSTAKEVTKEEFDALQPKIVSPAEITSISMVKDLSEKISAIDGRVLNLEKKPDPEDQPTS